jgi:hypothetical protein
MSDLPDPADRLNSWKEIAAFLGRTSRTVQRWERTAGLPIRRGGAGRRGTVVASKQDVHDWWQRRGAALARAEARTDSLDALPDAPARRHRLPIAVVAAVAGLVALVAAMAVWRRSDSGAPPSPPAPPVARALAAATSEHTRFQAIEFGDSLGGVATAGSGLVFVALPRQGTVAVVDPRAMRVVRILAATRDVAELALSPDGDRLYFGAADAVGVIDLARRGVRSVRSGFVRSLVVSPDGSRVWVALGRDGLSVLDTRTLTLTAVATTGCPMYLAAAPRAGRLFVSYQCGGPAGRAGHDAIEVRDLRTGDAIIARAGPPMVGGRLAVSPDEQVLWADGLDACDTRTAYDRQGCPAVTGAVLHAFRASTLDHLQTVGVPAARSGALPMISIDGARIVVAASGLHVVDGALGDVEERSERVATAAAAFSTDGRELYAVDAPNRALVRVPMWEGPDARALPGVASYLTGDGVAHDVVGGLLPTFDSRPAFAPGRLGSAFLFRSEEAVTFGERLDVSLPHGPSTYMAWLKPASIAEATILERGGAEGFRWWMTADGRVAVCLAGAPAPYDCGGAGLVGRTSLRPDTWSHVAIVRGDSSLSVWVNGTVDGTARVAIPFAPGVVCDASCVTTFGRSPNGRNRYRGLADELAMFRRALDESEISRAMSLTTFTAR